MGVGCATQNTNSGFSTGKIGYIAILRGCGGGGGEWGLDYEIIAIFFTGKITRREKLLSDSLHPNGHMTSK